MADLHPCRVGRRRRRRRRRKDLLVLQARDFLGPATSTTDRGKLFSDNGGRNDNLGA
jgi:hypothetical protein